MKILLAGYTVPGSGIRGMGLGIGRYIYYLGKELVGMGHDVELVVRDDFRPKEKWIKTAYSPKFSWYAYPFFLKQQLKNKQADVSPGQARLFVINRILGHVDFRLSRVLSWEFLSEELPDAWRMWRAVDALLAERVSDATSEP